MLANEEHKLADELFDAANEVSYLQDSEDFLKIIGKAELLLRKVKQNPPLSVSDALQPLSFALGLSDLLCHSDGEVRIVTKNCLIEIMRIMAPEIPYSKEKMKEIFRFMSETHHCESNRIPSTQMEGKGIDDCCSLPEKSIQKVEKRNDCIGESDEDVFHEESGGRVRSISAVVNCASLARNPSPLSPFVSRGFLYSTAIDRMNCEQTLLRVIESEINSSLQTGDNLDKDMTLGSFPFKIEDNPGHQNVTLTREYNGERIKVVVSMPSLVTDENDDDDGPSNESSIPLVVTVTKKSGLSLEFSCMAFPDEIAIDALSVKHPGDSLEDQIANEGPDFEDLDENLKKAFYKFLEIRGVKASTTNFLHENMMRKVNREYLLWLKNVKEFMEE